MTGQSTRGCGARAVGCGAAVLGLVVALSGVARAQPLSSYFSVSPGDVPIVITAPHGGSLSYPFPPRSCTGGQSCALDTNTRQLTQAVSNEFFALTGSRPYVVIAQGHRTFIDLNRSAEEAYEDPAAAPFYDYYHGAIDGFIDDLRETYGRGLLIDIHGQSAEPDAIFRGTQNGLTTAEMLGVFGESALNGSSSIMGSLDALGYDVIPGIETPFVEQVEDPRFSGAYTVTGHGSHQLGGIDAIQLEFGFNFRGGESWRDTAADLAIAMDNYLGAFLQEAILPGDYNSDGSVDAADYTSWRDGLGGPAGSLPNGVDGGAIGSAHYDSWASNYGAVSPEAANALPEPAAGWMIAAGLLATRCHRRRGIAFF